MYSESPHGPERSFEDYTGFHSLRECAEQIEADSTWVATVRPGRGRFPGSTTRNRFCFVSVNSVLSLVSLSPVTLAHGEGEGLFMLIRVFGGETERMSTCVMKSCQNLLVSLHRLRFSAWRFMESQTQWMKACSDDLGTFTSAGLELCPDLFISSPLSEKEQV